jgi:hypothetical protein
LLKICQIGETYHLIHVEIWWNTSKDKKIPWESLSKLIPVLRNIICYDQVELTMDGEVGLIFNNKSKS